MNTEKNKHRKLRVICVIAGVIVLICLAFGIYVHNYYHASSDANEALKSTEEVDVEVLSANETAFVPKDAKVGLIYYPGGKVEYSAYAPLMQECAERGILCVLMKMPFNLAFFDVDAADDVYDQFPEIEEWYIGGHSLGGVAASMYATDHEKELSGLILTGSYTTEDMTESSLKILYMYGSEDEVVGMEDYKEYEENLPDDEEEYVIEGGCHAGFGDYGAQKGDGTPKISGAAQRTMAADVICDFVN